MTCNHSTMSLAGVLFSYISVEMAIPFIEKSHTLVLGD